LSVDVRVGIVRGDGERKTMRRMYRQVREDRRRREEEEEETRNCEHEWAPM